MSNNVDVTPGAGKTVLTEEIIDPDLGTGQAQVVKIANGIVGGYAKWGISAQNAGLVEGADAVGGAGVANPIRPGVVAQAALPTAAVAPVIMDALADIYGRLVVRRIVPAERAQTVTSIQSTAETTIITGVANEGHDIIRLSIAETSGTPCKVDIRRNTGGAIIYTFWVPASNSFQLWWEIEAPFLGLLNSSANNWTAQQSAAGANVQYLIHYLKRV